MPDGGTTEVAQKYYGRTTEVSTRRAPDSSDGGRTRGPVSDGQPKSSRITEMTKTGPGRDGGTVQRLVLQPGTLATARALGNCPGRGVGRGEEARLV